MLVLLLQPTYLGPGDLHETKYEGTNREIPVSNWNTSLEAAGHCAYRIQVYTGSPYWSETLSSTPDNFAIVVAATFLLVLMTFAIYDLFVQRRQSKIVDAALRSHAVVASLFPSNVRARLFDDTTTGGDATDVTPLMASTEHSKTAHIRTLRGFLNDGDSDETLGYEGKPIADLCKSSFNEAEVDVSKNTHLSVLRSPRYNHIVCRHRWFHCMEFCS